MEQPTFTDYKDFVQQLNEKAVIDAEAEQILKEDFENLKAFIDSLEPDGDPAISQGTEVEKRFEEISVDEIFYFSGDWFMKKDEAEAVPYEGTTPPRDSKRSPFLPEAKVTIFIKKD